MEVIKSKENKLIKHVKKLNDKKYREEVKEFLIEGTKILDEVLNFKLQSICSVIFSEEAINKYSSLFERVISLSKRNNFQIYIIDQNLSKYISETVNPQGVFAIINFIDTSIDFLKSYTSLIVLDEISDPGNLGTIIRSADAFGFYNIIQTKGCVDIYNSKVIRASMGSIFHINFIKDVEKELLIDYFKDNKIKIISTVPKNGEDISALTKLERYALIIGNESSGVSPLFIDNADINVTIKMKGRAESLNASVAASIILYELSKK